MRKITAAMARPAMRLARSVQGADGRMLVSGGAVLTEATIKRLTELGIRDFYIEDPRLDDIKQSASISDITKKIGIRSLQEFEAALKTGDRRLPVDTLVRLVERIAQDMDHTRRQCISLLPVENPDEYRYIDALNVSLLTMAAASRLYPAERRFDLGLAGLLHDVGMALLPPEVVNSRSTYTDEEREIMRRHPELGAAALKDAAQLSAFAKVVILQHHERLDGSGYPRGSAGSTVHPFSQLVGLVDLYAAAVSDKPYGSRMLPHESLEMVMSLAGSEFDRDLVGEFLRGVAPYPVGSTVRLNTGDLGVIARVPRELPTRPTVRVLESADGRQLSQPLDIELSAAEHQTKLIVDVLVV